MLASFRKLLVLAPLLVFAAVGFAQARMEGNIVGSDGKPLEDGQIKLDRTDLKQGVTGVQSFNVKTDKKGHFVYSNLPPGGYDFTLLVGGKEMAKMADVRAAGGQ